MRDGVEPWTLENEIQEIIENAKDDREARAVHLHLIESSARWIEGAFTQNSILSLSAGLGDQAEEKDGSFTPLIQQEGLPPTMEHLVRLYNSIHGIKGRDRKGWIIKLLLYVEFGQMYAAANAESVTDSALRDWMLAHLQGTNLFGLRKAFASLIHLSEADEFRLKPGRLDYLISLFGRFCSYCRMFQTIEQIGRGFLALIPPNHEDRQDPPS